MSLQDSTFNTTHVMDNEIVKANDFEFAFENLIENVAKSTQMMLESTQDFVINGKVIPYSGMNVKVSPIYGVCKSSGIPFGRTELSESIGFEESTSGRVDIIQVKGEWETYDNQQRAFNDPDTDTQTYQYVDTKKLMKPVYTVKKGAEGSSIAPDVDSGYVKLAEVVIRANNSTITADDIKNITSDVAGLDNDDWTAQKDITYNIGYISDVNARFRVQHEADGTHSENCINSDALDIGTGVKQINGNILPVGGSVSIPTQTISATDSILSVITKTASMITSLYNAYLKFGNYKFNGELSISAIADANNDLTNPLKLIAAGDGTAELKIGNSTVLSIDANGKLSTNGYTASSNNHLITKAVTDAISTALNNLNIRVQHIEETSDVTLYTNGVLSSGTGGRFNIDSASIYAATTQDITLSGTQSIDGQTLSDGVYVLVKDQTDATENGIYQYSSSSAWGRVSSFATPELIKGKIFNVLNGTANKGKMFYIAKVNFVDPSAFGTDDINFLEYFGSINALANKIPVRDSSGRIKVSNSSSNDDAINRGELSTKDGAIAQLLLKYVYPVGSLYWSSKSDNPSTLFGGTWVQIKDRFVWAKGDSDTVNATGGAKTVTLTVNNLPSHNHSFTPSGSISITTNPTFTGTEHSHTYTPQGTVSSHSHTINSGNTSSSGTTTTAGFRGVSTSNAGSASGWLDLRRSSYIAGNGDGTVFGKNQTLGGTYDSMSVGYSGDSNTTRFTFTLPNHSHTSNGYLYGKTDNTQPTFTGTQATLKATAGGSISGGAYKFTGTASNTGNTGSGTAVDKMPPYVVKYCWERTA